VTNAYNYFHDFKKRVEYATMKIEILIENGRSLKLRQMRRVNALSLSSTTSTQPTENDGYQPISGLQGGLGVCGEGRGVG
jgi:hypothetical protein